MGRIAVGILALLLCCTASAVDVPWLYQVETAVASQNGADRRDAASTALLELLGRLSGTQRIDLSQPEVAEALSAPERYVRQYRYYREPAPWPKTNAETLGIAFEFDRAASLDLIKSAGLPLWWSSRPLAKAWILLQQDGEYRWLLPGDERDLAKVLEKAARRRGLPMQLPEAEQAKNADGGRGLSGTTVNHLLRAERGGDVEVTVIAELDDGGANSRGKLQIWQDGDVQHHVLRGGDAHTLINQMVDVLADNLGARYALASGAGRGVLLHVEGVVTPTQYADLRRYLSRLAFVDAANVVSLEGGVISLILATSAPPAQLIRLLDSDGQLVQQSRSVLTDAPDTAPNGFRVRWLGDLSQ